MYYNFFRTTPLPAPHAPPLSGSTNLPYKNVYLSVTVVGRGDYGVVSVALAIAVVVAASFLLLLLLR